VRLEIDIPIRIQSEANSREHWAAKHKRSQSQRWLAKYEVAMAVREWLSVMKPPLVITLTRIAPRPFDSDNLARAFKAIRDGVADALCINDGSKDILWQYDYQKGKPKEHSIRILIKEAH